jgi:uncharacterized membrane protein
MNKLGMALALSAVIFPTSHASAWFKICNTKANGADMYVTYAYYEPHTTTLNFKPVNTHTPYNPCFSWEQVEPPEYFTTWRNTGWWHLNQNQCATVYGPPLSNTWGYIYAEISDGTSLTGADIPFTVADTAFALDPVQYSAGPFGCNGGSCPASFGGGMCTPTATYWNVNTLPIHQVSYKNFTVNIY